MINIRRVRALSPVAFLALALAWPGAAAAQQKPSDPGLLTVETRRRVAHQASFHHGRRLRHL